jgi:hypothetical protein
MNTTLSTLLLLTLVPVPAVMASIKPVDTSQIKGEVQEYTPPDRGAPGRREGAGGRV